MWGGEGLSGGLRGSEEVRGEEGLGGEVRRGMLRGVQGEVRRGEGSREEVRR